ncbi:MAG TPA: VF530 family DNA-binding protein [Marinagarivorans sp.]
MPNEINYQNNPLHGLGLKELLEQLVNHYGFAILYAYLNINCFKTNPSIESSIKFLKKTDWAREKVEGFYLYQFKSLPRASAEQFELPPRDRVIPDGQTPGEPAELSLEDAEQLREKRAKKAADWSRGGKARAGSSASAKSRARPRAGSPSSTAGRASQDPWAKWRENNE